MAASLLGWIWKQDIGSTAKLVLFALNEHTNIGEHGDWRVFPSQARIAKMCGLSRRSVVRVMRELTDAGVIVVAHQHDQTGRQLQNLCWLQAPKLIPEEGQETLPTGEGVIVSHSTCHSVAPEGDKVAHNHLYKNPLIRNISTKQKRKSKTQIPDDFGISDGVRKWAEKNGHRRLNAHLDNFVDAAKAKDYRYVDWDAAFKTAIRKNWADIK